MVNIVCPIDGCQFETGDYSEAICLAIFNAHQLGAHTAPPQQSSRVPKVDRPPLNDNISEETWNAFLQSWEIFVRGNNVSENDKTVQLYSCCDLALKAKVTAIHSNILDEPVQNVLDILKTITVTPVAKTVKRNALLQMHQDADESIRTFLSRVKGKAVNCGLRKECEHPHGNGPNGIAPPAHVMLTLETSG